MLFLRLILFHEDPIGAHGCASLQEVVQPWNSPFIVLASSMLNVIPTEAEGSRFPRILTLLFLQQVSMSVLLLRMILVREVAVRETGRSPLQDVFIYGLFTTDLVPFPSSHFARV